MDDRRQHGHVADQFASGRVEDVLPSDIESINHALDNDERVRHLSLASEVSKLSQWDWDTIRSVARDASNAPEARKLAKALTKEAVNSKDVECRSCGSHLLARLAPVLGR